LVIKLHSAEGAKRCAMQNQHGPDAEGASAHESTWCGVGGGRNSPNGPHHSYSAERNGAIRPRPPAFPTSPAAWRLDFRWRLHATGLGQTSVNQAEDDTVDQVT
jgi:hypothetical protein